MCGINGLAVGDSLLIRKMNNEIRHRGPDDEGVFVDDHVGLGCCRLKIIDLSQRGHQPMSNREGDVWIVFNGEIYNFSSVRGQLEGMGYRFFSDSDTEVILHGYEAWGSEVVSQLTGMWAFAIYDARNRLIFLSRDRTGIKPLYYLKGPGNFAFSSELKVFAALDELRRTICTDGVRDLLMFGFNPGKRTVLDSVYKLGSGECLLYDIQEGHLKTWRYWTNEPKELTGIDLAVLENLIRDIVADHLISDVPVGCYVSGGIDSSVVALFYAKQYQRKLHTFHITFEGHSEERDQARLLSNYLGTEHHELELSPNEVVDSFDDLVRCYDLSITDPALIPNYFLSKHAKRYVTVVLAGEGGDELFAGYDYYRYFYSLKRLRIASFVSRVSLAQKITTHGLPVNERVMRGLYSLENMNDPERFLLRYLVVLPENLLRSLLSFDIEEHLNGIVAELRRDLAFRTRGVASTLLLDQKTLLAENFNYKADKSTSAASLEERVPLQDHRLVTYVNSAPFQQKLNAFKGKVPLRRIVAKDLPILSSKRKRGFVTPFGEWMKDPLRNKLESAVRVGGGLPVKYHSNAFDRMYERFMMDVASPSERRFLWNLLLVNEMLKVFSYIDEQ